MKCRKLMIGNWRWENKNGSIGKLRTVREGKPIAVKGLLQIATKYNTDSNKSNKIIILILQN